MNPQGSVEKGPGIVLDFDGVLVQSMELHAEAYRRALAPFSLPVSDLEIFEREGARSETIIAEYLRRIHRDEPSVVKEVSNRKQEIFKSIGPPRLYPGAEEMVWTLRKGVPKLGLVTGTRRENLERLIPELLPLFDAFLAQDAYSHDKPHPEPYLKTAERLGVPPNLCAALENAARGVRSARAAGFDYVVALPTTLSRARLQEAGANDVAGEHGEAGRLLLEWVARQRRRP